MELEALGAPIAVVGINADNAVADQAKLTARCSFPLFQDLPEVSAFALLGGKKDDFFVYDRKGNLSAYLPNGGSIATDLGTPEGYQNVRHALLTAAAAP